MDRRGRVFYAEEMPSLEEFEAGSNLYEAPTREEGATAVSGEASGATVDLAKTFKLHSRPGARRTIYLDFRSPAVNGTAWNSSFGLPTITPAGFDTDSNPGGLSDTELATIQNVWKVVAEDYAPFEIDVTTEAPPAAALTRSNNSDLNFGIRVVITKDWTKQTSRPCNCGGFAYVGAFDDTNETYKTAWVFFDNLGNHYKYIAEAASHEAGHTLGLNHDGQTKSDGSALSYYMGHGTSPMSWGPIMGAAYYPVISQWSRGEYAGANQKEDDLTVMQQFGAPLMPDDVGDTKATASDIPQQDIGQNTLYFTKSGLISTATDVDWYRVSLPKGTFNLEVRPSEFAANLDILVKLYDSTGREVTSSNPEHSLDAALGPVELNAGIYYISVDGVGMQDATGGYSDYGSLGPYAISGAMDVIADGRPSAVMALSTVRGMAPLVVNFSSTGSKDPEGKVLTYEWDFGDGYRQTGSASASHTYTSAGTYTPTLTVRDPMQNVGVINSTITVTAPPSPVVNVSATPTTGRAPLPVKLVGTATAATGLSIARYTWSFGDGTANVNTATANHLYEKSGVYTALLTVVDSKGTTTTKSVSITVTAPPPPVVTAISDLTSASPGVNITFKSAATTVLSNKTFAYLWNFGDGTPAVAGQNVLHAYAQPGQYVAQVQVTDAVGGISTGTVKISVIAPAKPTLSVKLSASSGYAPLKVSFTSTGSTTLAVKTLSYSWDFGDGSPIERVQNASHVYARPGVYTAVASVTDSRGSSTTATLKVTVLQVPTLGINLSTTVATGIAPLPMEFRVAPANLLPGATVTYQWNFGDGSATISNTATTAKRTYAKPGLYTITVRASDTAGRVAQAQIQVRVTAPPPPSVQLAISATQSSTGTLLKFTANASTASQNKSITYAWDFGDGIKLNGGNIQSHLYATPGLYTARLTVTDAFGGSRVMEVKITIQRR
jgi:PKD repeat protein